VFKLFPQFPPGRSNIVRERGGKIFSYPCSLQISHLFELPRIEGGGEGGKKGKSTRARKPGGTPEIAQNFLESEYKRNEETSTGRGLPSPFSFLILRFEQLREWGGKGELSQKKKVVTDFGFRNSKLFACLNRVIRSRGKKERKKKKEKEKEEKKKRNDARLVLFRSSHCLRC